VGAQALVGSSCTAYGSVTDPLTAADILGRSYWQNLCNGLTAGEALLRAKFDLAREMTEKQGFLDGEDQKTLIQFNLYGDPLAQIDQLNQKGRASSKEVLRTRETPQLKTVQEQADEIMPNTLPLETIETVKEAVAKYLPGMTDARMRLSHIFPESPEQPAKSADPKPTPKRYSSDSLSRQIITLHKQIQSKSITHEIIARFTIDDQGDIIKMTVSR
jgi:hypothetical protein